MSLDEIVIDSAKILFDIKQHVDYPIEFNARFLRNTINFYNFYSQKLGNKKDAYDVTYDTMYRLIEKTYGNKK